MKLVKSSIKKILIGIFGTIILIIGIITIPYPGPGWAVVFLGLAVLSTEFKWAEGLLHFFKTKYEKWQSWIKKQSITIQISFLILTLITTLVTVWLLNGYGYLNKFFNLGLDWLNSPIFK